MQELKKFILNISTAILLKKIVTNDKINFFNSLSDTFKFIFKFIKNQFFLFQSLKHYNVNDPRIV